MLGLTACSSEDLTSPAEDEIAGNKGGEQQKSQFKMTKQKRHNGYAIRCVKAE